ncbi:TetR/AcrR family transcriptional regulator [Streptomyces fuscigenes]|uniref:TetR/AcrR family transcriptional regulator n=1 Tax=Streptomyces fuscigenes TaxID=1528880 RepID=UPI001F382FAC|nr:TetR/AcrR family transcriptional regulator [Streptomyces fuscigenes]MCF3961700.1 TetR/AcrR family transcriptional regulator [Streptomyces fuscigenes]
MTGQRSDARRNYQRILAVAEAEVAAHGAEASQEQIARVAGVGSATVRRHFPTRRALLEAVFRERVEGLCEHARRLSAADDGRAALLEWLHALVVYAVSARGFAHVVGYEPPAEDSSPSSCGGRMEAAATPLLRRAKRDGAVAPHTTFHDLLTLAVGIALATEHLKDPGTQATRLFHLAVEGLSPQERAVGARGVAGCPGTGEGELRPSL